MGTAGGVPMRVMPPAQPADDESRAAALPSARPPPAAEAPLRRRPSSGPPRRRRPGGGRAVAAALLGAALAGSLASTTVRSWAPLALRTASAPLAAGPLAAGRRWGNAGLTSRRFFNFPNPFGEEKEEEKKEEAPRQSAPPTSVEEVDASNVDILHSEEELNALVASGQDCVVKLAFTWCRPCKGFWPKYVKFADIYSNTKFIKILGNENESCKHYAREVLKAKISPMFAVYSKGALVSTWHGANNGRFIRNMEEHLPSARDRAPERERAVALDETLKPT